MGFLINRQSSNARQMQEGCISRTVGGEMHHHVIPHQHTAKYNECLVRTSRNETGATSGLQRVRHPTFNTTRRAFHIIGEARRRLARFSTPPMVLWMGPVGLGIGPMVFSTLSMLYWTPFIMSQTTPMSVQTSRISLLRAWMPSETRCVSFRMASMPFKTPSIMCGPPSMSFKAAHMAFGPPSIPWKTSSAA